MDGAERASSIAAIGADVKPFQALAILNNSADARQACAALDGSEFDVTEVAGVDAALQALERRRFNVILLESALADDIASSAGIERLHGTTPTLPVVVLRHEILALAIRLAVERAELADRLGASVDEIERQRSGAAQLKDLRNDLIAVVAHDIKGPLTSIMGYAELIQNGFLSTEEALDAARTIRTNAQRLASLADDVLSLASLEDAGFEASDGQVDLVDTLQDVAKLYLKERRVVIGTVVSSAIVRGDAERLRQVFDNLVGNAVKYSPRGEPVTAQLSREDGVYRIDVRDRGIGIPPEEIPRLFERFSRASNAREARIAGSGIGLFVVRTILDRYGGTIAVASVVDEGSTFTIRLPAVGPPDDGAG